MLSPHLRISLSVVALALCVASPRPAWAKATEWTDTKGNSFKAEPTEAFGPFAFFRVSDTSMRKLPWRYLTPADCVRFFEAIRNKPARAEVWTQAAGDTTRLLIGNVKLVQGDKLIPAELKDRPEPEVLILFLADHGVGESWDMLGHSIEPYNKLKQAHPGMVEGLFFGLQHTVFDHLDMATQMKVPWLVTDFHQQYHLDTLLYFKPPAGEFGMSALTRDGLPLFTARNPKPGDIDRIFGEVSALLELADPANPKGWADHAYYLRAIQPVIHAQDRCDPVLVGNPLVAEGLKQRKVRQVNAQIEVAADGTVKTVTIKKDDGVPAELVQPLADALKKACLFVPAVDHGQFIEAPYDYHLAVSS